LFEKIHIRERSTTFTLRGHKLETVAHVPTYRVAQ